MSDLECPRCGNPSRDGGLDDPCEKALASTLAEAPALLDELLTQATRQAVTSIGGTRGADIPLPVNLKAADLAQEFTTLLVSWAKQCGCDIQGATGQVAAHWLAERIYTIRLHAEVAAMTDELVQHARECWRAVDRVGADLLYLGDCQALIPPNDVACLTKLKVRKGAQHMTCWRCEASYDVAEMLEARDARIDSGLATVLQIARAELRTPDGRLITARMIEGYKRRGAILQKGILDGAATFCVGDVKDAALRASYPKARLTSGDMQASA